MKTQRARYLLLVALSVFVVSACESKFAALSDNDLQDKIFECNANLEPSPGKAVSCGNLMKECERRREEGRFVC